MKSLFVSYSISIANPHYGHWGTYGCSDLDIVYCGLQSFSQGHGCMLSICLGLGQLDTLFLSLNRCLFAEQR